MNVTENGQDSGVRSLSREKGETRIAIFKPSEPYLNQLRKRYRKATKQQRGHFLDDFVKTTGYHRKQAVALLRGKRKHHNRRVPIRHPRQRIYADEDKRAVLWLSDLFDAIGSKCLRAAMDTNRETQYLRHMTCAWSPRVTKVCKSSSLPT
jgi:hypothetical protein